MIPRRFEDRISVGGKAYPMGPAAPIISIAATALSAYTAYKGMQNQKAASQKANDLQAQQLKMQQDAATAAANQPKMPGIDDATAQAARRRSISEQVMSRGRASTILTSPGASGSSLGA